MDYAKLTAPCGKDCFNCPLYIGEENQMNRKGFLQRHNISDDKYRCKGCRDNNGTCPGLELIGLCPECKTYACANEKMVEFCYECGEFPCAKLQPVSDRADHVPHALKIYNLVLIQKIGLQKWAQEYSKRILIDYYTKHLDQCM
jgi:hypothetical protein